MTRTSWIVSLCLIGLHGLVQCDKLRPDDTVDIPNAGFLAALIDQGVDRNGDGSISVEEAEAVTRLDIPWKGEGIPIIGLKGIEYFVNLEYLDCNNQTVLILELNNNPLLKELHCSSTGLKYLDISSCTALEVLDCSRNDVYLDCPDCGLKTLDLSEHDQLKELYCHQCLLSTLDLSNLLSLEVLHCGNYGFMDLDLSHNAALTSLVILDTDISELDLSENTALTRIDLLGNNELTDLNISSLSALEELFCDDSPLPSLDVSGNSELKILYCYGNQLSSLDVSNNHNLEILTFEYNQLSNIDVSNNPMLIALCGGHNFLTGLDLSLNPSLEYLCISGMPSLSEICVWTTPFPPDGFVLDTLGSPNVNFTTDCSQQGKFE